MDAQANQRVGDADREAAVALLGEQYAQGRLAKDELDERTDAAWSARTRRDLGVLFLDLPVGPGRPPEPPASAPPDRWSGWHGVGRFVVPVLVVLGVLTVLTHLPFLLLAVAVWLWFGPRRWGHHGRWGHRHYSSGSRRPLGGSWS